MDLAVVLMAVADKLNNNMRCIEIVLVSNQLLCCLLLNNNMGCIEIKKTFTSCLRFYR